MKKATIHIKKHRMKVDAVPKHVRKGVAAVQGALADHAYRDAASACASALRLLMDQMDFRNGACGPTAMIAAVVPREVLVICDAAKAKAREAGV